MKASLLVEQGHPLEVDDVELHDPNCATGRIGRKCAGTDRFLTASLTIPDRQNSFCQGGEEKG